MSNKEIYRKTKRSQKNLEPGEELSRKMIQNIPVGLYRCTPGAKGKYIMVNPSLQRMYGYDSQEELLNISISDHYWDEVERKAVSDKLIRQGQINNEEVKLKKKDGSFFWGAVTAKAVKDDFGEIQYFDGIIEDITWRKELEQRLLEEKQFCEGVIESLPGNFWMLDENSNCIKWNKNVEVMYGYNSDELHDLHGIKDITASKDLDRLQEAALQALRGGSGYCEYESVTKEGKRIAFAGDARRVRIDGKDFLVAVEIDITKRKEVETKLKKALAKIEKLQEKLQAENIYLTEEIEQEQNFREIVGTSDALKFVLFKLRQVAPTDSTVLIMGETGTGKDLFARAIHGLSSRNTRSLIKVNCATLPAELIESELFGHEKGAFTGALIRKIGRFELAHGSTIFLDEISELPLELQAKLLRVVEEGEFERLGGGHSIKVNVRIIAATNRNLIEEVKNGRFREDLLYRLNVFPLMAPPLRERKEDIPLLVKAFIQSFNLKMGRKIEKVSQETMNSLQNYYWPGNIRELKNVVERAVINSQGRLLHLVDRLERKSGSTLQSVSRKPLLELEKDYITQILEETGWKIEGRDGAAAILGLHPSTLRGKLRKLGISRNDSQTLRF